MGKLATLSFTIVGAWFVTLSAACGQVHAQSVARADAPPDVVILAGGAPCPGSTLDLRDKIADSAQKMQTAFGRIGVTAAIVPLRSKADLLGAVAAAASRPLVAVYSGHGALAVVGKTKNDLHYVARCPEKGPRCVSVACLDHEVVALDDLVRAVPPERPMAMLLADACTSAHVDVRVARGDVGMFSISPDPIQILIDGRTILTQAVESLDPSRLDGDCDGSVSDLELFDALNRVVSDGPGQAQPKYRRQLRAPRTLWTTPRRTDCRAAAIRSAEPAAPTARPDPGSVGQRYLVHGPVPLAGQLRADSGPLPIEGLVPLPCTNDLGQCFRLLADERK